MSGDQSISLSHYCKRNEAIKVKRRRPNALTLNYRGGGVTGRGFPFGHPSGKVHAARLRPESERRSSMTCGGETWNRVGLGMTGWVWEIVLRFAVLWVGPDVSDVPRRCFWFRGLCAACAGAFQILNTRGKKVDAGMQQCSLQQIFLRSVAALRLLSMNDRLRNYFYLDLFGQP